MSQFITVAELMDLEKRVTTEQISVSRMVEIINETIYQRMKGFYLYVESNYNAVKGEQGGCIFTKSDYPGFKTESEILTEFLSQKHI